MSEESDRAKDLFEQASAEVQRRTNLETSAWTIAGSLRQSRMEAENQVRQLAYNWGLAESKNEVEQAVESIVEPVIEPVAPKPKGPIAS